MRYQKKNYQSLSFTVLKDKLLSKEKTQTFRTLYIPSYSIGKVIAIVWRDKDTKEKEFLYLVRVTNLYPKKICDLNLEEAKRDGFDTIKDFQDTILKLNNSKDINRWGFITQWEDYNEKEILDYIKDDSK